MAELGELIKQNRLARKWSLRQLGAAIGVTGAYVADIEANRRLPSPELRNRISSVLEIRSEELAAADYRLSTDMREWIEERPQLGTLLRSLRTSPESDMLIQRLTRFMNRRSPPQIPRGFLVTWESELRAIAAEASAWSVETGGDLFGRWQDVPIILLATKAGPSAQRNNAHFRLDVEYLRQLSETFAADWALRYFGDWHSHHRLGLSAPSGGDQRRIHSIAGRNQFPGMTEIIVTLEGSQSEPTIRIHPWIYDLSSQNSGPSPLRIKTLQGVSPIRQALLARRELPEQELFAWERISWQRIRIGSDATPPLLEPTSDVDTTTRERALSQLVGALQEASGSSVEQHSTGFGCVLVAKLEEPYFLAFALGAAWPMNVLEVHHLNRDVGSTEAIKVPSGLVAPDIRGILDVFRAAGATAKGIGHVDG
ncbi:MAG: helix-turn-helix transcriptional regulator [Planctomycetes bacterium]|nr:helix-turn-helix transcriptional regulator [Planctomycetota bacterium]MBI3833193.1 helix-turn-helix transcriptional regulator [Planctomycetota bacterium]